MLWSISPSSFIPLVSALTASAALLHSSSLSSRGIVGTWTLVQDGTTGVAAMQLAIVSPTLAIIIDKVESNPLQIGNHSAWAALYSLETNSVVKPLNLVSNSFCAGGTFISNGTLVNAGGNPVVLPQNGDFNGIQGIRLFGPCTDPVGNGCEVFEDTKNLQMAGQRWYPTTLRVSDGSALIIGGTAAGDFLNTARANTASYEYFPKKNGGKVVFSPFLNSTLFANLFPIAFALPDDNVFIAANTRAILYNWRSNIETELPSIPNGVRVTYPMTGTAALLPLSPPNYTPEVIICGGSTVSDSIPPNTISSQAPASAQCSRMVLNSAGIAAGWKVEQMPEGRIMPDLVNLPNGQLLLVNGGKTGVAGYGNVFNPIGQSNADNPAFTPALYTPSAASGSRFSKAGMPTSNIARLYHSIATLTPSGNILITGSNPNLDVSTVKYATDYRVEYLNPPYIFVSRPSISSLPAKINFGQTVTVPVVIPSGLTIASIQVSLMDLGFDTHAIHPSMRHVFLVATLSADKTSLTITGPPNAKIYPPGPGYIYLVVNDIASVGTKVMIGTGANPPVS